ncbi:uncharacterized protein KY384_004369 [Bacidia gigantensis]|uniref:uncharacterized protein n=1 Tax=Bacidia gigantensis TaxID=2732470 RepID=UPI001D0441FA|nr:uncharacterized protein KY384_004369 [Bacidia gigantensis]KAG8531012.1 hypothetical protein KY384_004369 [Bacidia gigantensis]
MSNAKAWQLGIRSTPFFGPVSEMRQSSSLWSCRQQDVHQLIGCYSPQSQLTPRDDVGSLGFCPFTQMFSNTIDSSSAECTRPTRSKYNLPIALPTLPRDGSLGSRKVGRPPASSRALVVDNVPCNTYNSSSSESQRTESSFGAIGDHLSSKGKVANALDTPGDGVSLPFYQTYESNISRLVQNSEPDRLSGSVTHVDTAISRNQVNDIIRIEPSQKNVLEFLDSIAEHCQSPQSIQNDHHKSIPATPIPIPEVWVRQGPSYCAKTQLAMGHELSRSKDGEHDPATFALPYNSLVYMMKAPNVTILRHSVKDGVWTNKQGANRVLQSAWEKRGCDEKILLLFSITHGKHNGQFCGMAEMVGPYEPHAEAPLWAERHKDVRGRISIRWLVTKDVPFTAFDDLKYHGQAVTQLRHANTIPGETGRATVQRYFTAAHTDTAILHPASRDVGLNRPNYHQPFDQKQRFGYHHSRPHPPRWSVTHPSVAHSSGVQQISAQHTGLQNSIQYSTQPYPQRPNYYRAQPPLWGGQYRYSQYLGQMVEAKGGAAIMRQYMALIKRRATGQLKGFMYERCLTFVFEETNFLGSLLSSS